MSNSNRALNVTVKSLLTLLILSSTAFGANRNYNASGVPAFGAQMTSAAIRDEFAAVSSGVTGLETEISANFALLSSGIQWIAPTGSPSFGSSTEFSMPGNLTTSYLQFRRVKATVGSGAVYSEVVSSSYNSGTDTTLITILDAVLTNPITKVEYSAISPVSSGASPLSAKASTGYLAKSTNTATSLVLRDASGNFSAGTISAALTGNVTGNVTGSSGSSTGNALTATTLQTARAIQGVNFDGSAAINPINGTGFVKSAGTTLSYDNSTYLTTTGSAANLTSFPTLNQSTSGNAATATALQTARAIQGVIFDGTAAINPINGTGFVKASGATLSYDNSTYLTTTGSAANLTNFPTLNQSTSGNAATATALATARAIQGVNFDGTGAINPINGTGFVKSSGATLSYDNSTYLTTTGSAANLVSFPTFNQNTTGTATTATNSSGTGSIPYSRSENGLRIVRTSFSAAAAVTGGSGITATRDAAGTFSFTFANAFSSVPSIFCSSDYRGGAAAVSPVFTPFNITTSGFSIYITAITDTPAWLDIPFAILAIGVN